MGSERGQTLKDKTASVVRVGGGRGFVVEFVGKTTNDDGSDVHEVRSRIIVTAAHCLPMVAMTMDALEITKLDVLDGLNPGDCRQVLTLPPHRASYTHERTFEDLVGPLGGKASIWAECLFADPIADVALLREPDNQYVPERWKEYNEFVDAVPPLEFGSGDPSSVWVLDLSNEWREVRGVDYLCLPDGAQHSMCGGDFPLKGGMSGSPILDGGGQIVGLVSTGQAAPLPGGQLVDAVGGSCPRLPQTLPRWFSGNE